jgi:hypothetical protein
VVPSRKITKMLPRRGRISGKGKTIIWKTLHINAKIQVTSVTIAILMVTLR